jgi:hypothetical protein
MSDETVMPAKAQNQRVFKDIGWSGLRFMSGQVMEDPDIELRGKQGAEKYHEMRYSDATVSAVLMALSLPIREAKWRVNPASDAPADVQAAEFVESCLYDMSTSFDTLLTEACSMFAFGWAYLEWTLKRRLGRRPSGKAASSAYQDGLIGFRKIALRAQTSLWEWEIDDSGGIQGMWQERLAKAPVFIPIDKALLFRTSVEGNNPEGIAVIRPAWRDYVYKREIERIEAIGLQRAMMGVPVVTLGQGASSRESSGENSHEAQAETIISGMYGNKMLGVIEESEMLTFRFESPDMTGITGDSTRVIQRKDEAIARSALASWLLLGTRERGSYALARELGDMFFISVEGFLAMIAQTLSRWAVPVLFDYNVMPDVTDYPEITTSINRRVDLEAISNVINTLVGATIITPDPALEQHVRELAGLPRRAVELDEEGEPVTPAPETPSETQVAAPEVEEPEKQSRQAEKYRMMGPRLASYHSSTDAYQDRLQSEFDRWLNEEAETFADVEPERIDTWYGEHWPEAVLAFVASLKAIAWDGLPNAFELGYKSGSLPPDVRSIVNAEIVDNDLYMDTKLMPAIRDRISLPDVYQIAHMTRPERVLSFKQLVIGKRSHIGQYAGAFWRAIFVGAIEYWTRENWGGPVRWITDALAKHCATCLLFGDITYQSLRELLIHTGGILPGNGTECDGNCRCGIAKDEGGSWVVI